MGVGVGVKDGVMCLGIILLLHLNVWDPRGPTPALVVSGKAKVCQV